MAIRSRALLETPSVIVALSDHGGEAVPPGLEEEICDHYCVNFVESGEFGLAVERRRWRLGHGDAFAWHPFARQIYAHFRDTPPDVCLTVRFRGSAEREIELHGHLARAGDAPVLPRTNPLAFLRFRLDRILGDRDSLALDQWSVDLLEAIRVPAPGLLRGLDAFAPRVEEARTRMLEACADPHSLASLSSCAGMSPFHFARVFRALVGVPPHRFLRNARLDRALELLRGGASVTTTCYAVGFNNLSHFIRSFQRRFGISPSQSGKKAQAGPRVPMA
jgi:AraC-like DNA-binding protein